MDKVEELLTRGVDKIYPTREDLEKILRSGKKLKVYQGFDPTSPQLHIGHMLGLKKLRQFQDLGHEVIFLIGDFTATIGDPSGKYSARKVLTHEEALENAKNYKEQAGRILNFEGINAAKILYNGEWLDKMKYLDIVKLTHYLSVNQVIERDMFQKRLKQNQDVFLNEFFYPVIQAYDSVAMNVDVEVGGSDQMFNMMMGRKLMRHMLKKEKFVITVPLLTDAQGNKIGKSEGNVIALDDSPEDLFAKIMALPDQIIVKGFEYLTDVPLDEIKKIDDLLRNGENPVAYKKKLAFKITKELNGAETAKNAQRNFESRVQKKEMPLEITEIRLPAGENWLMALFMAGIKSNSKAKDLINQNAISINNKKIRDYKTKLEEGIMKYGQGKFVKIKLT